MTPENQQLEYSVLWLKYKDLSPTPNQDPSKWSHWLQFSCVFHFCVRYLPNDHCMTSLHNSKIYKIFLSFPVWISHYSAQTTKRPSIICPCHIQPTVSLIPTLHTFFFSQGAHGTLYNPSIPSATCHQTFSLCWGLLSTPLCSCDIKII